MRSSISVSILKEGGEIQRFAQNGDIDVRAFAVCSLGPGAVEDDTFDSRAGREYTPELFEDCF